jgi:signal transduction histidine kinase
VTAPLQVVSFPKSGRTWLRVMLDDVDAQAHFTHDESDHQLRQPLAALDGDKSKYRDARVLLLVRDPRDTAVSGYFQVARRLKLSDASLSDVLRDERHGIKKICQFNLQWFAAARQVRGFAIISYEQMHAAPAVALCEAAAFAGVTLDERIAELVASNRSFARLRAAEARGDLAHRYGQFLLPGDVNDAESFKVRRGVVGGYFDYMSEADQLYCDSVLAETNYWSSYDQAIASWGFERLR